VTKLTRRVEGGWETGGTLQKIKGVLKKLSSEQYYFYKIHLKIAKLLLLFLNKRNFEKLNRD